MANRINILANCAFALAVSANAFFFDSSLNKDVQGLVELYNLPAENLKKANELNERDPRFHKKLYRTFPDATVSLLDSIENRRLKNSRDAHLNRFVTTVKTGIEISEEDRNTLKNRLDFIRQTTRRSSNNDSSACTQKGCSVFAEIIKSTQMMYLYVDGELRDSFKVSTGSEGFETPEMDVRPQGPMKTKYSSTKYPGGNYKGLGNMPYVVFLKGPYAIHGTTPGNFSKLGTKASHGCVRLHPDNALVFFELVKLVGLENTWVSIREEP